jgi:Tol biopolymer transport system component
MRLTAGARLGTYEIVSPIGAGGMGEVYRARDTKLDRAVAIKVLPEHLSADPDALARFEREAKAVAALSHPNILAIHDFGTSTPADSDSRSAYGLTPHAVAYAVMELLEGGTLRDRLESGPLPAKKVVQIGVDIAQGLAAAHARGIVHRDLKPENVFVTTDGRVKILDFGLARELATETASAATALRQTDPGTVLGTVGYMSPEQVKGQPADHRSDVFSLGCVLYELASGRRAFQRETAAETMTAILREDAPDLTRDSGATPAAIEPVIRHCLEKQPDERFQSARDLAFALQALSGTTTSSGKVATVGADTAVKRRIPVALIAGAAVLVGAAFVAGRMWAPGSASAGSAPPAFEQITDDSGIETDPAISPDGVSVAFVRIAGNDTNIYVQRIGGRTAVPVAVDPARREVAPAFSPDGASIAFHDARGNGGIFVAGATGESARRVTDFGFHPAWSPDGQRLVFCTEGINNPAGRSSTSALWVVPAAGGEPRKILDGDAVQPVWSPSGGRIAYWAVDTGQRDLYTIPAEGGERTAVTSDAALDWSPRWPADGQYLYFASDRGGTMNIWRVAIDEATGQTTAVPEPVTAGVANAEQPSLSADGSRLVFRSSQAATNPVAMSFDPATGRVGPPAQLLDRTGILLPSSVSPDGQWLALSNIFESREDIFVARTDGTGLRRLTDDVFRDRRPVWSPDGQEIAFYSNRKDNYGIWAIKPDGSGLRQLTKEPTSDNLRNLLYPTYAPAGDRMVAARSRTPEAVSFDPRRDWTEQTPDWTRMDLPGGIYLVPSSWSPDGRRLVGAVLNSAGAPVALGVYEVAARQTRKVWDGPVPSFGFVWLGGSRQVLFVDPRTQGLTIVDVESGQRRELASGARLGATLTAAPDGRTLYAGVSRQQADLWMVELKGKGQ